MNNTTSNDFYFRLWMLSPENQSGYTLTTTEAPFLIKSFTVKVILPSASILNPMLS